MRLYSVIPGVTVDDLGSATLAFVMEGDIAEITEAINTTLEQRHNDLGPSPTDDNDSTAPTNTEIENYMDHLRDMDVPEGELQNRVDVWIEELSQARQNFPQYEHLTEETVLRRFHNPTVHNTTTAIVTFTPDPTYDIHTLGEAYHVHGVMYIIH